MGNDWDGWVVKVSSHPAGRGGGQTVGPLPTLEAAILSAVSCVYPLHAVKEQRARQIAEARGGEGE